LTRTDPTAVPEVCDRLGRGQMPGQLRAQVLANSTTEVGA
jgi:hypothetical protein